MATAEAAATTTRFAEKLRDYRRTVVTWITGPGLWVAIGLFLVWSFVAERDSLVVGIVTGSLFALGAIGITLIYGILKWGHFAHGDAMMLSGYLAFTFLTGTIAGASQSGDIELLPVTTSNLPGATDKIWNFSFGYGLLVAMGLAAVATGAMLVGFDRVIYGPLRRRGSGIVVYSIAALGVALILRSLMLIIWGSDPRFYSGGIREATDLPFDIRILYDQIFILAMAFIMMAAIYVLLYWTKLGKAMRAMSDNADLARISGINTDRIVVWTWAIAGVLVAIAGVMLGLQTQLRPELGFIILVPLFASAILGGVGSPQGALVGGLLIGAFMEVSVGAGLFAPGYKFTVAIFVLVAILLVRPRGLFGSTV
jgi:branched-chain amino acid transport system permease protein/neutral amino acid transport system permease protein